MKEKTTGFKNIIIFLAAFILGGLAVFGVFGHKTAQVKKPGGLKPAPAKMKMAKGGIMVSTRQRQLYGIRVGTVKMRELSASLKAVGEVAFSVPLEKTVTLKYSGYVRRLFADKPGMKLYEGEPLFTVYSPELVSSENDYILAYGNYEKLKNSGFSFGTREAREFLASSEFRLKQFDFTEVQINALRAGGPVLVNAIVYSPITGVLVEKNVFSGSYFKAGSPLFKIAGLSRVWMNVWIYEKDIASVKKGEGVKVEFDAYPGTVFAGRVSFIYPYLAGEKRVEEVRLVLSNPVGEIKPGMFGNAEITTKARKAIAVPSSAVLITGGKPIVFLYEGKGYFIPRQVTLGARYGDYYAVAAGLKAGERIVVSGTFLMSSDSNLSQATGSMAGMPGM